MIQTASRSLVFALLFLLPGAVWGQAASRGPAYDARLSGYEYPFEVRLHPMKAQQQTLEMAYMDVRPERANGRAVLLLHGKNFSGAYWERTIRALTAGGYRVIVPDQIGFGKSSKPERFQFSFQELATHTRGLLDALDVSRVPARPKSWSWSTRSAWRTGSGSSPTARSTRASGRHLPQVEAFDRYRSALEEFLGGRK